MYNVENSYDNGEYIVETSTFHHIYPSNPLLYVFSGIQYPPYSAGMCDINYDLDTGNYIGTYNNKYIDNGYEGDWLYIKLPRKIQLTKTAGKSAPALKHTCCPPN